MTDKEKSTKKLLFFSHIIQEPLIVFDKMLDVLLAKNLGATALQLSCLISLRPTLAIFAFYWGSLLHQRPHLLRFSLLFATAAAPLLFLFSPFAHSVWYFIAAEACYSLFSRGSTPAQMEVLKQNVTTGTRETLYSKALSISYFTSILISPLLGLFSDHWKELYTLAAALYLASAFIKRRFIITKTAPTIEPVRIKDIVVRPWKDSLQLLQSNNSFLKFQIGFFIAGSAIMFMKPTIALFLTKQELSTFELLSLITIVDAAGFLVTSRFWAHYLHTHNIHRTSSLVVGCFAIHPLCLLLAWIHPLFLFAASFFYGAAQAGSRLIWNMSGPILCGRESSAQYTSVNILAVSIRGCIVPILGGIFTCYFGAIASFQVGMGCLLAGSLYHFRASRNLRIHVAAR